MFDDFEYDFLNDPFVKDAMQNAVNEGQSATEAELLAVWNGEADTTPATVDVHALQAELRALEIENLRHQLAAVRAAE